VDFDEALVSPPGVVMVVRAGARSRSDDTTPPTAPRIDARTRALLDGSIVSTLLRLATPNVLVMFVQASVGLIETYFVARLGTDALAGVALVFPVLMLMRGDVAYVFVALSAALAAFGLINAGAVAGGAWFGAVDWRRPRSRS
jgi:hypothetical protein